MSQGEAEIESPTGYDQCPVCGEIVKSKGKYGHFSRKHSELNYEEYKDKFKPAKPPEAAPPPEGGAPYKVEPDVNAILRDILETSKNNKLISQSVVDEIMDWATRMGSMDPNYLNYLLTGMRGVSAQTANIISSKYAMTLQKAQQEGRVQLPFPIYPPAMPTAPGTFPMFPYQPTTPQPSYWTTIPTAGPTTIPPTAPGVPAPTGGYPPTAMFLTREEYIKMQREQEEKSRLDRLEDRLNKLDKDFAGALTSLKEDILTKIEERQPGVGVQYEEVKEFIDGEGNLCAPDNAASVRIKRVPITTRGLTAEDVRKIVKEEKEVLTAEKVRTIVKEETEKGRPSPIEEHPRFTELKTRLDQTEARYGELKEKMEAEDRKRIEDTLKDLREEISNLRSRPAGQYTEDTFRMLDTSVRELASILKEKKPMETAKEILLPQGVTPGARPSERAGEEERGGVLRELGKHGLVARVIERVRG